MNVTEQSVIEYIEEFHSTLEQVANRFFEPKVCKHLLHQSLLPAHIICYVSTQYGVGFEYLDASETKVEAICGNARIEDIIVQAPKRLQNIGPMFNIEGPNTQITRLTLADGFPFRLMSSEANVTFQDVRFECRALNWLREIKFVEVYGDRRAEKWSIEAAQNRAKDEVLAALSLYIQAEKKEVSLHEFVSSFQEKTVLVLGSYDNEGEKRLIKIAQALKKLGYEPLFIKDIPDFEHYDILQKVTVVGVLSRFIVIDDTTPSGHLMEIEICRNNRWITILLRGDGRGSSWMTAGASNTSTIILEKEYKTNNPYIAISESVAWAEERLIQLKKTWNNLYPWRV